jgi:uncharacterized membrane protein
MSDMQTHVILATFADEDAASAAMDELFQSRKAAKIDFDESAVILVDADGTVHIKDAADISTGKGASRGAIVGGVIGLLAGPAGVVLGAGAGAAVGGLLTRGDEGFRDEALEALGKKLVPHSSAIVAVVPDVWAAEFAREAGNHSRDVSTQVLDSDVVAQLQGEASDGNDES